MQRLNSRFGKDLRDGAVFLMGLIGVIHETFFSNGERPTLLLLFAAMIGLPAFLRMDEKKSNKDE